jgi:hypothetical protein
MEALDKTPYISDQTGLVYDTFASHIVSLTV